MAAKIHINGRFLFSDHPTGTHRSAECFVRALAEARGAADIVLWCNPKWPRAATFLAGLPLTTGLVRAESTAALHLWEQTRFTTLTRDGIGLHLLGTGPAFGATVRQVMLVHDLNSLIIPEAFSWKYRQWSKLAKYRAIRKAGGIFCLTEYVRSTLADKLGLDTTFIRIIPQGPGVTGIETVPAPRPRAGRRHFLCVGSLQPHKNLSRILAAWRRSGLAAQGYELRIIGRQQKNFVTATGVEAGAAQGVTFTGYVTDAALIEQYRSAVGVVFPSLHEGFGLPIVEAFFSGTPVLTSRTSCMSEVAGDAAHLVDPGSEGEIAGGMRRLAGDDAYWQKLVDCGWKRREQFTWRRAGRLLAELLDGFQPGSQSL